MDDSGYCGVIRTAIPAVLLVLLAGCWNGTTINLGSVSLGHVLAQEADASQ